MKRTRIKKVSKIGYYRNKCDKLLSPWIIKEEPSCIICGKHSQVAHHFVHKSKSNRLRYERLNLIPLCHSCHFALHQNESYYAARILNFKGLKWWREIEKMKQESIKVNREYYERVYTQLLAKL